MWCCASMKQSRYRRWSVYHLLITFIQRGMLVFASNLFTVFEDHGDLVTLLNDRMYVQLVLESSAHGTNSSYHGRCSPTTFRGLLFLHSCSVLHEAVKRRKLRLSQIYPTGTRIGYCGQLVRKALWYLTHLSCVVGFKNVISPYMWYD